MKNLAFPSKFYLDGIRIDKVMIFFKLCLIQFEEIWKSH